MCNVPPDLECICTILFTTVLMTTLSICLGIFVATGLPGFLAVVIILLCIICVSIIICANAGNGDSDSSDTTNVSCGGGGCGGE